MTDRKTFGQVELEKIIPAILNELIAVKLQLAWEQKKSTDDYEQNAVALTASHAKRENTIKHYLGL